MPYDLGYVHSYPTLWRLWLSLKGTGELLKAGKLSCPATLSFDFMNAAGKPEGPFKLSFAPVRAGIEQVLSPDNLIISRRDVVSVSDNSQPSFSDLLK